MLLCCFLLEIFSEAEENYPTAKETAKNLLDNIDIDIPPGYDVPAMDKDQLQAAIRENQTVFVKVWSSTTSKND